MKKRITLTNDFHNTSVTLIAEHVGSVEDWDGEQAPLYRLAPSQIKRAKRALCAKGCLCSGEMGTRGHQEFAVE